MKSLLRQLFRPLRTPSPYDELNILLASIRNAPSEIALDHIAAGCGRLQKYWPHVDLAVLVDDRRLELREEATP